MSQPWSKIGDLRPPPSSGPATEAEESAVPVQAEYEKRDLDGPVADFLRWIATDTPQLSPTSKKLVTAIHKDIHVTISFILLLSGDPSTTNPLHVSEESLSRLLEDFLNRFYKWARFIPVKEVKQIGLALCKLVWKDFDNVGLKLTWRKVWVKNVLQVYWGVEEAYGWNKSVESED